MILISSLINNFSTGNLKFPKGFKSPIKYEVYVERFKRSKWHREIINRKGDDFCTVIQNPVEPWYGFFSNFKKKECPFPPGHVETFENERLAGVPEFIPYNLIGKYRFVMNFTLDTGNGEISDCNRLSCELVDM